MCIGWKMAWLYVASACKDSAEFPTYIEYSEVEDEKGYYTKTELKYDEMNDDRNNDKYIRIVRYSSYNNVWFLNDNSGICIVLDTLFYEGLIGVDLIYKMKDRLAMYKSVSKYSKHTNGGYYWPRNKEGMLARYEWCTRQAQLDTLFYEGLIGVRTQ